MSVIFPCSATVSITVSINLFMVSRLSNRMPVNGFKFRPSWMLEDHYH